MNRLLLSALVVARNEESQLVSCLSTLDFADEIIVVVDRSSDRTAEIAESLVATTIKGVWPIEGDRRNVGIEACSGEWILEVDADERVTQSLASEIRIAIQSQSVDYYLIPFDNYVGSTLVRYGWGGSWGVSSAPRLFRKGCKRWGSQRIHPSLELQGNKGRLSQRMIHKVDRDISDMLHRLDSYSEARAADLLDSGDIGSLPGNIRRFFSRFLKCYLRRRGYREGGYGFLIALMAGLYPLISYLRARLERGKG